MEVSYTHGTHLQQPMADTAPTVDYLPSHPQLPFITEPSTQSYYIHPATSGFIVEMGAGAVVDVSA